MTARGSLKHVTMARMWMKSNWTGRSHAAGSSTSEMRKLTLGGSPPPPPEGWMGERSVPSTLDRGCWRAVADVSCHVHPEQHRTRSGGCVARRPTKLDGPHARPRRRVQHVRRVVAHGRRVQPAAQAERVQAVLEVFGLRVSQAAVVRSHRRKIRALLLTQPVLLLLRPCVPV